MNTITQIIFFIKDFLWSGPLLVFLVGVGIYLTIALKGIQFRYLGHALKLISEPISARKKNQDSSKKSIGDLSSFESLMTALAGAIGTGNITGIATAVVTGGYGALFWMWVIAFLGMTTAYAETLLGLKFRVKNQKGEMTGGPMETLANGLKDRKMAAVYALLGAFAAFGIGSMVQSNSVVDAVVAMYPVGRVSSGIVLTIFSGAVILGGISSIGRVASILVPGMAAMYIFAGVYIIAIHVDQLGDAFFLILKGAFTGQAALGGFLGSTVMLAIQQGASYGIFANEAGLGSLAIAGSTAKVNHPAKQGMLSIAGVFIATMVVCSITGFVIAVTDVLGQTGPNGQVITGSPLAILAFGSVHDSFRYVVLVGLILFAFTTLIAWAYYGEKCCEFLFGLTAAVLYRWVYTGIVFIGAVLDLEVVWAFAHMANGLMIIPNLISIVRLREVVKSETKIYLDYLRA